MPTELQNAEKGQDKVEDESRWMGAQIPDVAA